jgi:hypothetical protein
MLFSMPDEPQPTVDRDSAIRELVRLLRIGYKAYLAEMSDQPDDNPKHVSSEHVRDPAA